MGAPPAVSVLCDCSLHVTPGISSLGVSVSQMGVRGLVLGEETAMVVVAMGVGVASVVLGLVCMGSVAVSADVGLHEGLLGGGGGMRVVVLGMDVLSLGALGVSGSTMGGVATTVVRGFSANCGDGKGNGECVHFV